MDFVLESILAKMDKVIRRKKSGFAGDISTWSWFKSQRL